MGTTIRLSGAARKWVKLTQLYRGYRAAHKVEESEFVPGVGNLDAKVLIIGETSSTADVEAGEPWSGKSGGLLTKLLRRIDLRREDVWLTNLVKHVSGEELRETLPTYHGLMRMEIDLIDPAVVVTLGCFATAMFFQNPHMPTLAGAMHIKQGRVVVPLYSPQVARFDPEKKDEMRQHIQAVADALEGVK